MLQGFENLWWEEMLKAGVALEEGQQCGSWIVWDGVQVVDKVHRLNKYTGGTKARMAVYDFKTMYTCIPLDDLTDRMHKLIREVFVKRNQHVLGVSGQPCVWLLQLSKSESKWVQSDQRKQDTRWLQTVDADRLCLMLSKLVTSTYIKLGEVVLWQKIGIPMGTNCAPFLANLYCFAYELAFLRSLVHSPQARTPGSREYRLIRGMHETSRYIDDLLTLNFPEFEEVMYRRVDEVDPPPGSGIVLSGIYPRGFRHSQANIDDDLQASQATTEPSSSQAPDSQQDEGLVLERVQPKPGSREVGTDQVDYLDVTIKQDKHGWHCDLYDKKDAMSGQAGRQRAPSIETELSIQCKYGVIHS